ncbi:hypothetical protein Y032_0057g2799 [Ancylostoma ceylanicum]|uniref:Uncharacterized protein n=1 Tax=Ancylostoma ceylanicum TaxID=53326 RepID=A0A016U5P1_9BILA|nr:hypothetical protein Y032_0057g2799 [Ancylostoma ceylanicum]
MLGTQLGQKVDANFVRDQYQEFLIKNKAAPPPVAPMPRRMTKLEKRAEMRKRGIFVEADNTENDYSFMERPTAEQRPYVCKVRTSKLKWKRTDSEGSSSMERKLRKSSRRRKRSKAKAKRRRSSSMSGKSEPGTTSSAPGAPQPTQPGGEAAPSAMMTPSMMAGPTGEAPSSMGAPTVEAPSSMGAPTVEAPSSMAAPSIMGAPSTMEAPSTMGAPSTMEAPSTMQAPSTMAPPEGSLSLDVTQKGPPSVMDQSQQGAPADGNQPSVMVQTTQRFSLRGPSEESAMAERAEKILEKVTQDEQSVRAVRVKVEEEPPSERKPPSKEVAGTPPDEKDGKDEKSKSYFGPDVKVDTLKVKDGERSALFDQAVSHSSSLFFPFIFDCFTTNIDNFRNTHQSEARNQ